MPTYNALVNGIANLHSQNQPNPVFVRPALTLVNQWIPTVVDTTTAGTRTILPVIVAVGANYATGPGNMPTQIGRRGPPWVQANLNRNRSSAIRFLAACSMGRVRLHWNGLLAYDFYQRYHLSVTAKLQPDPHFVMTNLSPWITTRDWSIIRDNSLEDLFTILAAPGMGLWSYFRQLKRCVGNDAIWIGHGNADVYGFFRLICWKLKINEWFFTSNLSQRSRMILPQSAPQPGQFGVAGNIGQAHRRQPSTSRCDPRLR